MFILLSYRTGNLIVQFDSIVSFIAALILLFRETSHTVQARVVSRMLTSSHQLVADLSAFGLGGSSFFYVPEGRKVGDVMLVPTKADEGTAKPPESPASEGTHEVPTFVLGADVRARPARKGESALRSRDRGEQNSESLKESQQAENGSSGTGTPEEGKAVVPTISNLKFVPPGRAMAELFLRETALKEPDVDGLITALPQAMVAGFQLASSVSVSAPTAEDRITVTLAHPVLANNCGVSGTEGKGVVGCEVCSMIAVLFSSSAGRLVSLQGCTYDEGSDASTTSLHLEAKYPPD